MYTQHERPHKVIFFVPQDMAVPYVFVAIIDQRICIGRQRRQTGRRIDLRDAMVVRNGLIRCRLAITVRQTKRHRGNRLEANCHNNVLERVHPQRFLPADFIGWWWLDRAVPAHAVDDLDVQQMEMHRVGVHTVVRDLPELRLSRRNGLRYGIDIG